MLQLLCKGTPSSETTEVNFRAKLTAKPNCKTGIVIIFHFCDSAIVFVMEVHIKLMFDFNTVSSN